MKKLQIVLGLFVCAFMVIPFMGVKAINVDNIGGNVTSEQKDNVWYLTLKGNDKQDIEIRKDETVILDLNGFNLTNYTDGCSTIWVQNGGTLTIVDSKGTGTIKKLNASAAPTIKNDGTLVLEGGLISSIGEKSAALNNAGDLTVKGGTITTEADNVFGLVNEGTTVIEDGKFIQAHNFSALNNASKMEIKGGEFAISEGNTGAYSLITNQGSTSTASLEVTGGTFNANKGVFFNEGEDKVTVSGGSYSHDVSAYLADGFEMKEENGEFVLVDSSVTPEVPGESKDEVKDEAENPKTSDGIVMVVIGLAVSAVVAIIAHKKLA